MFSNGHAPNNISSLKKNYGGLTDQVYIGPDFFVLSGFDNRMSSNKFGSISVVLGHVCFSVEG